MKKKECLLNRLLPVLYLAAGDSAAFLSEARPIAVAVVTPAVVAGAGTVAVVFVARAGDVAITVIIVANHVLRTVGDGIPHISLVIIDMDYAVGQIGAAFVPVVIQIGDYAAKAVVLGQGGVVIMYFADFATGTV